MVHKSNFVMKQNVCSDGQDKTIDEESKCHSRYEFEKYISFQV